nr:ABC transporter permease subunit [Clostridia bacterium]
NDVVRKLSRVPEELTTGKVAVRQIVAGSQYSLVLTEEGYLYFWGNGNLVEMEQDSIKKSLQNNIARVAAGSNNVVLIMNDGSITVLGMRGTVFFQIPDDMPPLVDAVLGETAALGLTADGRVAAWGGQQYGMLNVPEDIQGHVTQIAAGRYHFTVLLDDGTVRSWGRELFGESTAPRIDNAVAVYAGYFQNYAVTSDGKVVTWGKAGYLMGSDDLGRDVFRRLLTGGRISLTIGAIAVLISMVIGVIIGGISGFYGGQIDNVLMRLAEIVGSIPFLPLAMTLSSIFGNKLGDTGRMIMIMIILGVLSWPGLARLIRGQILAEREKEFVTAAKALGIRERVIIFRHILPNVISVVIVNITLRYATSLLTESSLSFLGFGVVPPNPTWGNMLSNSQSTKILRDYWWRWIFPAAALSVSTIAINCFGDGLRDAIDPKSNER